MLGAVVVAVVVLMYYFTVTSSTEAKHFLSGGEASNNILGGRLRPCSAAPEKATGIFRDGLCATGPADPGAHTVCAVVDDRFLEFTKSRGDDLSAARPPSFPGLTAGDKWCLCASRWKEALQAGCAPPMFLRCTHEKALGYVSLQELQRHAAE